MRGQGTDGTAARQHQRPTGDVQVFCLFVFVVTVLASIRVVIFKNFIFKEGFLAKIESDALEYTQREREDHNHLGKF